MSPTQPRRNVPQKQGRQTGTRAAAPPPEIVDPRWLLKAIAAVAVLGLVCAYLMVCALFYNQQWQFVLHPSRVVAKTPAAAGLAFEPVRFGVDAAGKPQLAGWWLPSDLRSDPTVLVLHGQEGSMGDTLPALRQLHDARLNILVFDYRGYGESGGAHPSESGMRTDALDALHYLTQTRGVPASSIVVYGADLGASLAVELCRSQPQLRALILQSADGDTKTRVERDPRARIVPVFVLFHERFPLADPLHTLKTPKLLLSYTQGNAPVEVTRAAEPKLTAELPPGTSGVEVTRVIRRFLETYFPQRPASLTPAS